MPGLRKTTGELGRKNSELGIEKQGQAGFPDSEPERQQNPVSSREIRAVGAQKSHLEAVPITA